MRINKDDQVLVLSGANNGKKSRVIAVDRVANKVTVEGVNIVRKHVRRSRRNPQGGRLAMEMPISISNVKLICPLCAEPTRVGAHFAADGAKYRFCKKCKKDISLISPAKETQKVEK